MTPQPVWITPAGSLGVIQEQNTYRSAVVAEGVGPITYRVIAGTIPSGMQFLSSGVITGIPDPVGQDTVSRFTVRATAEVVPVPGIADRTFSITVSGNDIPTWVTPAGSIGSFYSTQKVNYQFQWKDDDPNDVVTVKLVAGQLPGGLTLSPTGLLTGHIQPPVNLDALPGYDITAQDVKPYDFLYQAVNKNYEFTLETTDGKSSDLRVFSMYVYDRATLNASTIQITGDNTFITADETTAGAPFLVNADPSNLGNYRSNNYYAYQFVAEDFDILPLTYAISVNKGVGLPPGLSLDPTSGWYYGYIPDQGATETTYDFNIVVYKDSFEYTIDIVSTNDEYIFNDPVLGPVTFYNTVTCNRSGSIVAGQPIMLTSDIGGLTAGVVYYVSEVIDNVVIETPVIDGPSTFESYCVFKLAGESPTDDTGFVVTQLINICTATTSGTNVITCNSTEQLGIGQPLIFVGTSFGGLVADIQQVYYVHSIVSPTEFTVTTILGSTTSSVLTTDTGLLQAKLINASEPYPFSLTITGAIDNLVTWITPSNLGDIVNGSISTLKIEAENRGGRTLLYRLKSGAYNLLPQGLELLPTGEIVGRVSFDTFSLDLGATTFDKSFAVNRNIRSLGTTFDLEFEFTVNAYAPDSAEILYKVKTVTVVDGGTGYSSINPPTMIFSSPAPGATSVQALVGTVTVVAGSIVAVEVFESGDGYLTPATLTVTQGFGGTGGEFEVVMEPSGSRDAVSAFKTFNLNLLRVYDEPYQNLLIRAMPPQNDRDIIKSLLSDSYIFPTDWLYRPDDPNFGLATDVTYAHAYGLAPKILDVYVEALYKNHYWKNLVLGSIETAQALDNNGNVIYEVVYSKIIDNLVNNNDQSVAKIVNLPYEILDPVTLEPVTQVYPNSLDNMRTQMADVVGKISDTLPRWMVSKQTNGNVLGYTPAWVIAYTIPGKSKEIAYRISTNFTGKLNQVDFKVDRYILDCELSRNWNYTGEYISGHNPPPGPEGDLLVGPGTWNPQPPTLTTFDRFYVETLTFLSTVNIATRLAYTDINGRTLSQINDLGGFDGILSGVDGNTLIFAKQQDYSNYSTTDAAWQDYVYPFDSFGFSEEPSTFDESVTVPGGGQIECFQTYSATNQIRCNYTAGLQPGQEIVFVINAIGGIVEGTTYYVLDVVDLTHFTITATAGGVTPVSLTDDTGLMYGDAANERMAIYTISVDPTSGIVSLTLTTQTHEFEYVEVLRGDYYSNSYLYYPGAPAPGLIRVDWEPVPIVQTTQTTFDQNSMQFVDPVDMYDPGETFDKYLVFPKSNILV